MPIDDRRLGTVPLGLLSGVGLDLMAAISAPYDQTNAGRRRAAQRRRRTELGFHPRRLRAVVARGGAYTFGGGNGSRVGSGLILPRIALRV
jgi:hypothetical protein